MDLKKRNEEMREFFDEKSEGFDDVHNKFAESKAILTEYLPQDARRVLDLGGGTGMELVPMFERYPDLEVTVVDISAGMLKRLAERPFADHLNIICGDFFEADFGGGYDAVISTSTLHHFTREDKVRLYAKVLECLKPGGKFLNCDYCAPTEEDEIYRFEHFDELKQTYRHLDTPLYRGSEKTVLEKAGFADVEILDGRHENYYLIIGSKAE